MCCYFIQTLEFKKDETSTANTTHMEEGWERCVRTISHLFSAYKLKGCQQLASVLIPSLNREPGQTGGGSEGGLAHAAAHELIRTLDM